MELAQTFLVGLSKIQNVHTRPYNSALFMFSTIRVLLP